MKTAWQVTLSNLRAIPGRWGNSLATVIGVGAVVSVLASTMMMTNALQATIESTSRDGWAIIVREGAVVESMSAIPRPSFELMQSLPELDGVKAYPHFVTNVVLSRSDNPEISSSVLVRGLTPGDAPMWSEVEIVAGRNIEPGRHELVVGRMASRAFEGLTVGDSVPINGIDWSIVGSYDAEGIASSELRADLETLMNAAKATSFSSIRVELPESSTIADLNAAIENDRRLKLNTTLESEFFDTTTSAVLFEFVAYLVSAIMAVGATFASISVMYTSIDSRTLEIATLRALGFPRGAIAFSILGESLLLATCGGLLGLVVSAALFHGTTYTTGNMSSIVALLAISPEVAGTALAWALAVGLAAAAPPALRANRIPIANGLRWEG